MYTLWLGSSLPVAHSKNSHYSYPPVESACHGQGQWCWLTVTKCFPFPNNGFPGWLALGGAPMAGLDQSIRTGYWLVYRSETTPLVTIQPEPDSYLNTWCAYILLAFSSKCASHVKRQRRLLYILKEGKGKGNYSRYSVLLYLCVRTAFYRVAVIFFSELKNILGTDEKVIHRTSCKILKNFGPKIFKIFL